MKKAVLLMLVLVSLVMFTVVNSEQTVGLFVNEEESFEGYTLFAPLSSTTTYLIDNQGLLINSWESELGPRYSAYLDTSGCLIRSVCEPEGLFSGIKLEKMDWEGNVVWSCHLTDYYRAHHDIEVLPNGNILVIAWDRKGYQEAVEAGRDTQLLDSLVGVWPDHIIEIPTTGDYSGQVIWDWSAWDRIIQDRDPELADYGVIADHPELADINYVTESEMEWTHFNSVDYNEQYDQILVSARHFNEVWIIDHSTTTIQARGHTGGIRGKGGDILYRWGNPQSYDRGEVSDQLLFLQHDAQWISSGCPGEGNVLMFNNGNDRNDRSYSSVDEIVLPVDEEGNYYMEGDVFDPEQPVWSWTAPEPADFYARCISGAERLPNGNTLICDGPSGEFFEVTADGDIVWRYINPVGGEGPVYQGDSISGNTVFKVNRYAPDFIGFEGKDMTPGDPIEKYHSDVSESFPGSEIELALSQDLFSRSVDISYGLPLPGHTNISIYDVSGQIVRTLADEVKSTGNYQLSWNGTDGEGRLVSPGVYFCSIRWGSSIQTSRMILIR